MPAAARLAGLGCLACALALTASAQTSLFNKSSFLGRNWISPALNFAYLDAMRIGGNFYADAFCSTPGVYDATCLNNSISAAKLVGGRVILGPHDYNTGTTTVNL
ncbi:MAG: hypothetical protein ACTHJX_07030, partial [Terriglobales bacterium]